MSEDSKRKTRRLRRNLGFILSIVWILFWYIYLNNQHEAVVATGGFWDKTNSGISTFVGVIFAVITCPIGFLASHWLSSTISDRDQAKEEAQSAAAAERQQRLEEETQAKRLEAISNSDKETRTKNARAELILKIGSVSELLELLPLSKEPDRLMSISQSARKELREIVAKYPMPDLVALIGRDEVLRLKTDQLCKQLMSLRIKSEDADILKESIRRSALNQKK